VYRIIVAWLAVGENLRIAVFMVTSPSRKVLIVRPPEVRSGSRRVEHRTCPSGRQAGWLCRVAEGLVVDFPSFEVSLQAERISVSLVGVSIICRCFPDERISGKISSNSVH